MRRESPGVCASAWGWFLGFTKSEKKMMKISTFFMRFMVTSVDTACVSHTFSMNYLNISCRAAKIVVELHTWDRTTQCYKKVKALRVLRAVNNGWRFTARIQVTRRAFLSSRVIQRHGKSWSRRLVKNWCKWVRTIKISKNLWIRLTPEQFSYFPWVNIYPGIHMSCLFMRYRKISLAE